MMNSLRDLYVILMVAITLACGILIGHLLW